MSKYTVITADIVSSREIEFEPTGIKDNLANLNQNIQVQYPFTLMRGDEIQGVLAGDLPAKLPRVVRNLRFFLYPCQLRVGIGTGSIQSDRNTDNPWELNGEAFYKARSALEQLEDEDEQNTLLRSEYKAKDKVFNSLWLLMDMIQSEWTDSQWEAIYAYEQEGTYRQAAAKLGIALQNVEKRCRAAGWQQFRRAETNMQEIIELFAEGQLSAGRGDS